MSQSTKIGQLEVELSLNKTKFDQGASGTSQTLQRLQGSFVQLDAQLLVSAAKWVAAAGIIRGLVSAFDKATEHADMLGKVSQKIGMSVEQLSKLEYAAKLADVDIQTLSTGLKILSKNLSDVAGGDQKSDAARTLAALGVSVRDARGQIRPTMDVLAQLADKFESLNDSAAKTTLAMNLFGRRSGPDMIPLLNSGASELRKYGDEAERVGAVVTGEAAKNAEHFRDNLTRLEAAGGGLAMKLSNVLLPSLVGITEEMNRQVQSSKTLLQRYNEWGDSLRKDGVESSTRHVAQINDILKKIGVDGTKNPFDVFGQRSNVEAKADSLIELYKRKGEELAKWKAELENAGPEKKKDAPILDDNEALAEREAELNEMLDRGKQLMTEQLQPMDELIKRRRDLAELLHEGVINENEYANASTRAAWTMRSAYASAASAVAGALANVFNENKAVAIASALVSTYEAAAKALAAPPGPPISYAYVAAALANGFAQVRAIQNTNKGSAGGASTASASATPAVSTASETTATQPSNTLFVQGFSAGQFFSGDSVRELADKLVQYQRDGGKVVIA